MPTPSEAEIIEILEKSFYAKKGTVGAQTDIGDVIKDSMDFVELVAILTTHYRIRIDPRSVGKIRTVADVARLVTESSRAPSDMLSRF